MEFPYRQRDDVVREVKCVYRPPPLLLGDADGVVSEKRHAHVLAPVLGGKYCNCIENHRPPIIAGTKPEP